MRRRTALIALMATCLVTAGGRSIATDEGTAFEPPQSEAVYDVAGPYPAWVKAADNTDLALDVWIPAPRLGRIPPPRLPVVLSIAPYAALDRAVPTGGSANKLRLHLVPRGYAFVTASPRGIDRSGGCWDNWSDLSADDGARIVEWAGSQPWSNGRVGLIGQSAGAFSAWTTALGPDKKRLRALKAMIAVAGSPSLYEAAFMDGTPNPIRNVGVHGAAFPLGFGMITPDPVRLLERPCTTEQTIASTDVSGDVTSWWRAREHRDGVANIRAATLIAHGIHDVNVPLRGYSGFLERWPADIPLKLMLGSYRHGSPADGDGNAPVARVDWLDVNAAWFDRYLKNIPNGVDSWPDVQVQDANGQWRSERGFTGLPRDGALALSANGVLGASHPDGETTYVQGEADAVRANVAFTTPPLADDLRIYGDPVIDLWVKVSDPAAKIGVRLDAIDPNGDVHMEPPYASTIGGRSMRHLQPYIDGRFAQEHPIHPPLDTAFQTTVRFAATDMLVPAGSRLRLSFFSVVGSYQPVRVSGNVPFPPETVWAEGASARISVLHDCSHPTVLRFAMADPNAERLNIRGPNETGELASGPSRPFVVDGGGLARAPIC